MADYFFVHFVAYNKRGSFWPFLSIFYTPETLDFQGFPGIAYISSGAIHSSG